MKIQNFLKEELNSFKRTVVGRICARIEELEDIDISSKEKSAILKNQVRNLVPELCRDLEGRVESFYKGRLKSYKVYKNSADR